MPRTYTETLAIATLAENISYAHPPAELEPVGQMYEDDRWDDLVDWFRENTDSWSDAVRVYCATRFDQSLDEVSIRADSWIASTAKRIEREDDPDGLMSKTFFTADTHFGHRAILSMCDRPFSDIDEHDRTLIANWNAVVGRDDVVYHLGDFAYRCGPQQTRRIFDQLNGEKHLLVGNHDFKNETQRLSWASINELTEVEVDGTTFVLCHYGLRSWRNMRRGAIQLFGHSHGRLPGTNQCLDVGVDNVGYVPVDANTIRARLVELPQLVFLNGTDEEPALALPTSERV